MQIFTSSPLSKANRADVGKQLHGAVSTDAQECLRLPGAVGGGRGAVFLCIGERDADRVIGTDAVHDERALVDMPSYGLLIEVAVGREFGDGHERMRVRVDVQYRWHWALSADRTRGIEPARFRSERCRCLP